MGGTLAGGQNRFPSASRTQVKAPLLPVLQKSSKRMRGFYKIGLSTRLIQSTHRHLAQILMLENNIDKVLSGRTGVRFFFPLCGKALDMKWIADMGHSVVGVEISEKGIKQFFEDNNMTYSEEPVPAIPGAKVFKSSERNISLYQCDLFNFSSSIEGQFGAIWDRGSLVAINPRDREKYAALIISLMAKDCRYLLDTLLYNPESYGGPPFLVPDEQVASLFGNSCDLEQLQSLDALDALTALTDRQRRWGLDYLTETVHLITPKST
ncbi:probable thiopurine S-methyltransferase isoform X2 [Anarrhichthys ocellatus]|uniref:probable thiopurine S-methyltransferase isoform X2 n=1 Tax=Anarrhichthys ocellatus TaxID=433405 RepID=UPI0012ED49F7|nr:thiopurine S-methyltransferase isoform X2 [Anarrhichthys ocellatus]